MRECTFRSGSARTLVRGSEEQLRTWMLGGLEGDAKCHTQFLRALVPLLSRFFGRRISADLMEVDDLVQEVLITVHERRKTYDRTRPVIPWLFAIARHKMIDYFRRSRRHEPFEGLENVLADEGFEESSTARVDVGVLIRMLPEKQARAILYTRLQQMSVAEAAREAGLSESDVKISVHRGIRALSARVAQGAG